MTAKYQLIVVDDHPLVRRGIVESLSEDEAFHIIGEGENADDAVDLAITLQPHLIFLDRDGAQCRRQRAGAKHPHRRTPRLC